MKKYVANCLHIGPKNIYGNATVIGQFYWEFHPYTNISQKRGRVTPGWDFDPVRSRAGVRGFLKTESEKKKLCRSTKV